jgi:hypothetical protein
MMAQPMRAGIESRPVPASWFTIAAVLLLEVMVAVLIAGGVAQAYISYECGQADYHDEHVQQCDGGFPYPLF